MAVWLDTEYMIVVNQDGTQHHYERVGGEMLPLAPVHNPAYVAESDPVETLAADLAYLAQTLLEMGNPPEMVMRQGEEFVEFNAGDGSVINLVSLVKDSPEVTLALAEHLWQQHIAHWEKSANEVHGYIPKVGSLAHDDTVVHFTEKWARFSQHETSSDRAIAYELRDQLLASSGGILSRLRFFDEAGVVNHLMSLGGETGLGQHFINTFEFSHDKIGFDKVNHALNQIGIDLMGQNDKVLASLFEAGENLPSSYYSLVGEIDLLAEASVDTAIDWDIHMVWAEQARVTELIVKHKIKPEILDMITKLMTVNATGIPDPDIQEATEAIGWAVAAVGGSIDFNIEEQRRAIGAAMMFRAHEYIEQDFEIYYRAMMSAVKEQAGQDVFTLPTVGEVLNQSD